MYVIVVPMHVPGSCYYCVVELEKWVVLLLLIELAFEQVAFPCSIGSGFC